MYIIIKLLSYYYYLIIIFFSHKRRGHIFYPRDPILVPNNPNIIIINIIIIIIIIDIMHYFSAITLTLSRPTETTPWGLKLEGGHGTSIPLCITAVSVGSVKHMNVYVV